jgi:3-methyladenine DNA glycosylase Tag
LVKLADSSNRKQFDMDRCDWAGPEQIYLDYHDTDWGVPEYDSRALWEKLILDGFQAGLSWLTILKKIDNFRNAFAGFVPTLLQVGAKKMLRVCYKTQTLSDTGGKSKQP